MLRDPIEQRPIRPTRDGVDVRRGGQLACLGPGLQEGSELIELGDVRVGVEREEHIPRPRVDAPVPQTTLQHVEQWRLVQHVHHVWQVARVCWLEERQVPS